MAYDDHQWALLPLLLSSMLVYILLVATMFVRFRYRVMLYITMILYFHQDAAKDTGESSKINSRFNESGVQHLFGIYYKYILMTIQKPFKCKRFLACSSAISPTTRP